MKQFLLATIFLLAVLQAIVAQVGIGTATPHPSARLDITSTNSGLLIPRMTGLQRIAIRAPATGLEVFDNDTKSFWFYTGTAWKEISVGSNGWNLTGNTGTNPSGNFIGTSDNQPLRIRVNNNWAGEIHPESANLSLGMDAGKSMTGGQANVAIGDNALLSNTDGNFNVATGYLALTVNTTGINNTALGTYALTNNTTASANTALGRNALFGNITGQQNTAVGKDALLSNTTNDLTAVGFQALTANTTGDHNNAFGSGSLKMNTTGTANNAFGFSSLLSNTTGSDNVAMGDRALMANTDGVRNIAIGTLSLMRNTSGINNTAVGDETLTRNTTGNQNTAIGELAMYSSINGNNNVAVGSDALFANNNGSGNVSVGAQSLFNNTAGSYNTAVGYQSMVEMTGGLANTGIGYNALNKTTFGNNNTAVGINALYYNTGGSNNIAIGNDAGTAPAFPNLINTIGIGNTGSFQHGASNQVVIGNSSMLVIGGKVGWSVISGQRVKRNIHENVKGIEFIMKLRPVTYNISNDAIAAISRSNDKTEFAGKRDCEKVTYTGFLAQEVEQAALSVGYDFSGYTKPQNEQQFYTIRYAEFVVPLIKALQEQQVIIGQLQQQNAELEKRLSALEIKK